MDIKIPQGRADDWTENVWENYALGLFLHEQSLQSDQRQQREMEIDFFCEMISWDDDFLLDNPVHIGFSRNLINEQIETIVSTALQCNHEEWLDQIDGKPNEKTTKKTVPEDARHLKTMMCSSKFQNAMKAMICDAALSGEGYMYESLLPVDEGNKGKSCKNRIEFMRVGWDKIWCDSKSIKEDLSDANHLFCIETKPSFLASSLWPIERINELRSDVNSNPLEDRIDIMHAYFRIKTVGSDEADVWFVKFWLDEKHERLVLLEKPRKNIYKHKQIPFSRMIFELSDENNLPTSPIINDYRHFVKANTKLLSLIEQNGDKNFLKLLRKGIIKVNYRDMVEIFTIGTKVNELLPQFLKSLDKSVTATCNRARSIMAEQAGNILYDETENQDEELWLGEKNGSEILRGIKTKDHRADELCQEAEKQKVANRLLADCAKGSDPDIVFMYFQYWMLAAIDTNDENASRLIQGMVGSLKLHGVEVFPELLEKINYVKGLSR